MDGPKGLCDREPFVAYLFPAPGLLVSDRGIFVGYGKPAPEAIP